ncbi:MAG TPA: hypothetical protein VGQ75_11095 [Thermoanaerobaculia bacterium]|jgi:hypothetical protein|nr:hypothetical protein [Thermoanaerobaculia bacterium]HEV8609527.1 hypothetical protein [Thermoanaerobaculia bacterium]
MTILEDYPLRKATALSTAMALLLTCSPLAARTQLTTTPGPESPIEIAHDPLACMTPVLAPEIDAGVTPGSDYDRSYVYFRAAGSDDYYYSRMDGPAMTLAAILPRPLPETRAVDYFLRAYDLSQSSKRKGDWTPPVVPGTACKSKGVPVGAAGAGLTIGLTRQGQNPYPPGFNKKDIAKIILVSGAIVTIAEALKGAGASSGGGAGAGAGAGTAGAAGGLSTAAIVAGAAAVAGGAVAVAAANKDDNPTATPTPTVTPTPTIPLLRFIEVDVSWSGVGDVEVKLMGPSGRVGQTVAEAGCESTANRTERVVLQPPPNGAYHVDLEGKACAGATTPTTISVVVSVQSDIGQKCANQFVAVPVPGTVSVPAPCSSFSVP